MVDFTDSSISRLLVALDLPVRGRPATIADGTSPNTTDYSSRSTRVTVNAYHARFTIWFTPLTPPGKRYTLILKDELLPRNPENGREQSTISYEYDFDTTSSEANDGQSTTTFIPWSRFTPTFRGKEKKDAPELDTTDIKRISIMMRR